MEQNHLNKNYSYLLTLVLIIIYCKKDIGEELEQSALDEKSFSSSMENLMAVSPMAINPSKGIVVTDNSESQVLIIDSLTQATVWNWKAKEHLNSTEANSYRQPLKRATN